MTNRRGRSNAGKRPTLVGLKLALAASSLVASLLGAQLLGRAEAVKGRQQEPPATPRAPSPQVVVVRRYVQVSPTSEPVLVGSSQTSLAPIPTAVPYTPPAVVGPEVAVASSGGGSSHSS